MKTFDTSLITGTATSSPSFSGVSPLLRIYHNVSLYNHILYRMYMIVVLHPRNFDDVTLF